MKKLLVNNFKSPASNLGHLSMMARHANSTKTQFGHTFQMAVESTSLVFAATLNDNVKRPKVAMTMGSMTTKNIDCDLFESIGSALTDADATISAVLAGKSSGVSHEHLSKIF